MNSVAKFVQWASLFVDSISENKAGVKLADQTMVVTAVQSVGVTETASDLLRSVDAGGVPAFVSSSLREIARDNGLEVADDWTPNQIIDALRKMAQVRTKDEL